jgi:MFS family permease
VYLFRSRRYRKVQLIRWHGLLIPLLPLLGLAAWNPLHLAPATVRWTLLLIFGIFTGLIGAIVTVWMDWLAHLFRRETRGSIMGVSFFVSAVCGWAGAQLAACVLRLFPGDYAGYALLYLLAGAIATLSILTFLFIHDPAQTQPDDPAAAPAPGLAAYFLHSCTNWNFLALILGRLLGSFGFCIMPLVATYYISSPGGHLSGDRVVAASSVMFLTMAVSHLAWGWLGDHYGHRLGIVLGVAMQLVALIVLFLVPAPLGCYLVYACAGVCLSAGLVPQVNLLLETCPHDSRQTHLAVASLLMSPGAVAAPILAGKAAESFGLRPVFLASMAFSAAALLWMLCFFHEPRTLDTAGPAPR